MMIKTTYPIYYGGAAPRDKSCQVNCDNSKWYYSICELWESTTCAFVNTGVITDQWAKATGQSAISVSKMIPMFAVLIVLGFAVGLSKGNMRIGSR